MPLLARMVATPMVVDIREDAIEGLPLLMADQRISVGGRVAVVTSAMSAPTWRGRLAGLMPAADWFSVADGTITDAVELERSIRSNHYDALVGIGGGRVLDAAKYVGTRLGLPVVAVATSLAHDGVASPVAILENEGSRDSYGVAAPFAVVIDLTVVRSAPRELLTGGIGDVLSNLSAVADWELSQRVTGEPVDGLAVALARSAGESLLHRDETVESDDLLRLLADALVLSGLAMSISGTSRPCSGGCHEISHAIDRLYPERRTGHGQQVALGAAFATWLRDDDALAVDLVHRMRHHGLPVVPGDIGLDNREFARAVAFAPQTRPGRFTVLEHLDLDEIELTRRTDAFVDRFGGTS